MWPLNPDDPERVGPYALLGRLGEGGMGTVYLGSMPSGRPMAIKVVHDAFAGDAGFRERFRREVAAARAVSGAFTAPLIDADPDAAVPWLATAYLAGPSLQEAVDRHGPLPVRAVRTLGAALAEALVSIHQAGVTHRDVKPSNVIITADGPRLIDFGIARAAELGTLTETGHVVGSPGFMAPEQALGRPSEPTGDVFSLGAVLVFAATGESPFGTGKIHAVMYRVVHAEPRLDGVTDPVLRGCLAECLAKDPADRPSPRRLVDRLTDDHEILTGTGWLPAVIADDIAVRAAAALSPPVRDTGPAGDNGTEADAGTGAARQKAEADERDDGGDGDGRAPGRRSGDKDDKTEDVIGTERYNAITAVEDPDPAGQSAAATVLRRRGFVIGGLAMAGTAALAVPMWRLLADGGGAKPPEPWQRKIGKIHLGPVPSGDLIYISPVDGEVQTFDARTGSPRWRAALTSQFGIEPVLPSGGQGGSGGGSARDGRTAVVQGFEVLQAFDTRTGTTRWSKQLRCAGSPGLPAMPPGLVVARGGHRRHRPLHPRL